MARTLNETAVSEETWTYDTVTFCHSAVMTVVGILEMSADLLMLLTVPRESFMEHPVYGLLALKRCYIVSSGNTWTNQNDNIYGQEIVRLSGRYREVLAKHGIVSVGVVAVDHGPSLRTAEWRSDRSRGLEVVSNSSKLSSPCNVSGLSLLEITAL